MLRSFFIYTVLPALFLLIGCSGEDVNRTSRVIKESSYNVVELCNHPELRSNESEVIPELNKPVLPYNVEYINTKDSINVTFDFVSECCLEFDLQHIVRRSTLKILYLPKEDSEVCECYCDYRASYSAVDSEIDFSKIKRVIVRRGIRNRPR